MTRWSPVLVALAGCTPTESTIDLTPARAPSARDSFPEGPGAEPRAVELGAGEARATLVIPAGTDRLSVTTTEGPRSVESEPPVDPGEVAPAAFPPCAFDWTNNGGTERRDGAAPVFGPTRDLVAWSGGRTSIIAWQPVTAGSRLYSVRQLGFPADEPGVSPVVAQSLATGAELWTADIPFRAGDWTTWIAGVRDGRVYAGRSGNGASVAAPLYALDAATGSPVWVSADDVDAGPYDGVVFADNGDLIVGNFTSITRIRATDGATVWTTSRTCSVSSSCGPARRGDAIYVADAAPGGHQIVRFDATTGARQYASPVMSGFTLQNTPFVGSDGTVYLSRSQNNPSTDYFYAFDDTGTALTQRWRVPAAWTTFSEYAVSPDDSVLMLDRGNALVRLDPATGATLATSGPLATPGSPRIAVDLSGKIYASNREFATGRIRVFAPSMALLWETPATNINIGGPLLGTAGTLALTGVGTDVRAWRGSPPSWATCP